MLFDLSADFGRRSFETYAEKLLQKGARVDLKEFRPQRTDRQNRYLHLIINFFALQYGETADYVKAHYFKEAANAALFVRTKDDRLTGQDVTVLRSSAELSVEELSEAIERFKNWSAKEAGILLPDAIDREALDFVEYEIKKNKKWL